MLSGWAVGTLVGSCKKNPTKPVRWKRRYLTGFPNGFWQAGGSEGQPDTGAGGMRSDGLVACMGPANLHAVPAMRINRQGK